MINAGAPGLLVWPPFAGLVILVRLNGEKIEGTRELGTRFRDFPCLICILDAHEIHSVRVTREVLCDGCHVDAAGMYESRRTRAKAGHHGVWRQLARRVERLPVRK